MTELTPDFVLREKHKVSEISTEALEKHILSFEESWRKHTKIAYYSQMAVDTSQIPLCIDELKDILRKRRENGT